jgi:hypothetical protein
MSDMDENRPSYELKAPPEGSSVSSMRLPPATDFPEVDDHLDPPEITRLERIGGRVMEALPAEAPHAIRHGELDYLLRGTVADGYLSASDLKTRFDEESDFASDGAVLRDGVDPKTGKRHLEELAFEVVSEQRAGVPREKAARMHRRGVRRIFAVFVKEGRVGEWSPKDGDWRMLDPSSTIEDRCLVQPLPVAALLEAAAADDTVAAALVAKDNTVIREIRDRSRAEGKAEGKTEGKAEGKVEAKAESILAVMETRGFEVGADVRRRVLACTDPETLDRWLRRATGSASIDEVFAD